MAQNPQNGPKMAIFGQILAQKMKFFPETHLCLKPPTKYITYPKSSPNEPTLTTKNLVDEKFGPLQILCPNFSSTKFFAVQIFRQVSNQVTLKDRI